MEATKVEALNEGPDQPMIAVVVAEPVSKQGQNDSSAGLARMYQELMPAAIALRSAASMLLCFSLPLMTSPEGMFGLVAACGVLCFAAPGSLGTAYAARCTHICALISAAWAFCQIAVLATVTVTLPELPGAIGTELCQTDEPIVGDAMSMTKHGAYTLVTLAASAHRRLEKVAPAIANQATCAEVKEFVHGVLPYILAAALALEIGIFVSALKTAKAAKRITLEARRYGANAM